MLEIFIGFICILVLGAILLCYLEGVFSKDCNHEFSKWRVVNVECNKNGSQKITQKRTCTYCGLTKFKSDTIC